LEESVRMIKWEKKKKKRFAISIYLIHHIDVYSLLFRSPEVYQELLKD
jgi:hypothetical protein